MRKIILSMLIVLTANSMIAQGFYDKNDASENALTVAIIGDPQYGFPSGTDPEPSLGNAITTYEDLNHGRILPCACIQYHLQ